MNNCGAAYTRLFKRLFKKEIKRIVQTDRKTFRISEAEVEKYSTCCVILLDTLQ